MSIPHFVRLDNHIIDISTIKHVWATHSCNIFIECSYAEKTHLTEIDCKNYKEAMEKLDEIHYALMSKEEKNTQFLHSLADSLRPKDAEESKNEAKKCVNTNCENLAYSSDTNYCVEHRYPYKK